jgi:hypothetical protein
MLNQSKNKRQQQPKSLTPEALHHFQLTELEAGKPTIEALNDEQLEEVVGGAIPSPGTTLANIEQASNTMVHMRSGSPRSYPALVAGESPTLVSIPKAIDGNFYKDAPSKLSRTRSEPWDQRDAFEKTKSTAPIRL